MISVIIPTYKSPDALDLCIKSAILGQKYKNQILRIFINKKISENLYEARDENYNIILLKCGKEMLGQETEVKILEIGVHHLIGAQL